jgi:hypothetical protein
MSDLSKLGLLVGLYGGLGILALLILLGGAFAAQRKSSVIAIASIAGICVFLHAVLLYFVSDMGRGWSGGGGEGSVLVMGGGAIALLGALAIPYFLSRKLAGAGSVGPADTTHAAAVLTLAFLVIYIASSLLRSDPVLEPSALLRPRFWLVSAIGAAVAWGLRRHARWAWWLGLAGAAWELFRFARHLVFIPDSAANVLLSVSGLMALLQCLVVALLLHKNSRHACLQ